MPPNIARVAVPVPLRKTFDFLLPDAEVPEIGARVRVPFGRRKLIGLVVAIATESDVPFERLKPVIEVLDDEPIFSASLWHTLQWMSSYYLAPIGDVLGTALPAVLREGKPLHPASEIRWQLSNAGRSAAIEELNRAPLQMALIKRFINADSLCAADFKSESTSWRSAIQGLIKKGWIEEISAAPELQTGSQALPAVTLNEEQEHAFQTLKAQIAKAEFCCTLLHGVTGSGKTEVYFSAMREVLASKQQVLLLVPEIGLTPQLIDRIRSAFDCGVVVLHSGLTDTARHQAWWHARQGNAQIVVGTRSAVFVPLLSPGLIIVDEEHDGSLKQQDGVRYQARDVAVYRAKQEGVPIVLGSATPSLETLKNAQQGRYQYLKLSQRATNAALPSIGLLDLRALPTQNGLAPPMISAIQDALTAKQQVMLFLNRRGFAPVLYCKACEKTSLCHRCDSHLTFHQRTQQLRCHHCGYESRATGRCHHCDSTDLAEVGEGTQRVEDALEALFPQARILRIDRDSTRRKGELEHKLQQVAQHDVDIVLGTQLLSKGHDFPHVRMVGILGADQGLYSTDFRARETLFQQLVQVAGRAGRRDQVGRVLIQTAFPNDEFFSFVRNHDFDGFAQHLLSERKSANFPPFGHFAVLRAESTHQVKALQFLRRIRQTLPESEGLWVMDAIPAPMERRAGRYRAQLLFSGETRATLKPTLQYCLDTLEYDPDLKKLAAAVRWSLDVDPADLF